MAADEENRGGGVRAVVRAIDILKSFDGEHGPLSVAELQRKTGLSRPTLYRLLGTLVECDMLRADGEPQRFQLGSFAARIGQIWLDQLEIDVMARPILESIRDATGETCALFLLRDDRQFCVAECRSRQTLWMSRGIGELSDAFRGASGKAILAWLDPAKARRIIEANPSTDGPPINLRELSQIRRIGYALSHGAVFMGALSVAAPVFDHRDTVIGSMGLFGPQARIKRGDLDQMIERLLEGARRLSSELGAPPAKKP